MNLKDLVNLAGTHARTVMIGLQQDLVPVWLCIDKDGQPVIIATPWSNDREKALAKRKMKTYMRDHGIDSYSFVTEAWQATVPAGTDLDELTESDRPTNRADRIEVVVACATDNAHAEWRMWKTIRNSKGQVVDLERLQTDSEREPEGWMRDMLDF